jgi:hypothetical protein
MPLFNPLADGSDSSKPAVYVPSNSADGENCFPQASYVHPEPIGPLEDHRLPLNDRGQVAIQQILAHLDCEIDEYFLMSGIDIPKGGSCVYNKEEGRIELKLDRPHLQIALMLIGDLMLHCSDDKFTKDQILERYAFAGHPMKSWLSVWMVPSDYPPLETLGEQTSAGQPATRPELKSDGSDKPQPESEGRSR